MGVQKLEHARDFVCFSHMKFKPPMHEITEDFPL